MGRIRRVGFSEFLGVSSMISLGAAMIIAISGGISNNAVMRVAGVDTPVVMLIGIVLHLPLIAVMISRATEARGGATAYGIVRRDAHPPSVFATGWLTLGGYLSIAALMVQAIALRVDRVLEDFLAMDAPLILLIIPVAVAAAFGELVAPTERSKTRAVFGWVAVGLYVFFIAALFLRPPVTAAEVEVATEPSKHWLTGAALTGAALWFVDVLLDYRRQFRRSDRTLAGVVAGSWIGVLLLAIGVAILVLSHPDLLERRSAFTYDSVRRHQIGVAALAITLLACGITLWKAMARLLRVSAGMARDGLLPAALEDIDTEARVPVALLSVITLATVFLAWLVPGVVLVSLAAITFAWTGCVVVAGMLKPGAERPTRGLLLPGHPVVPVLAAFLAGFGSLILRNDALLAAVLWLAVGAVNYLALRGGTRELTRVDPDLGGETQEIPESEGPRILVCIGPASRISPLIELGSDIAKAKGGDAIILEVVSLLEQVPRGQVQRAAEAEWNVLQRRVTAATGADDPVRPLVRIAPTTEAGILAAVRDHDVDVVVMDWPIGSDAVKDEHKAVVESVVAGTSSSIAIVRGSIASGAANVVVASAGGPDTVTALRLGRAIAQGADGRLSVYCVRTPLQSEDSMRERLAAAIEEAETDAEIVFATDDDPKQALVKATEEHEVLIVGLTRDRAVSQSIDGSLWMDLIRSRTEPTVLVRRAETVRVQWIKRLWEAAFHILPTLSVGERAEVYALMRHAARAGVDFYVLIVISTTIATLGLFQDSAAVIIGAMLVAPLMSPIVSIAQGIVQGNLRMMRKGMSSTMKGTAVAVSVATLYTLLVPDASPTPQILARTEPTLLDLGVGLAAGAAAAYGISRKSVAAALPGVAIAVALVPPLGVVGYGIGSDRFDIAVGSTLLFLTNLVAIILMSAVIFLLLGFYPRTEERRRHVRGAVGLSVIGALLLAIPLGLSSFETTRVDRLERVVEVAFRREVAERDVYLEDVVVERESGEFVVRATVYAARDVRPEMLGRLRDELEEETGLTIRLQTRVLRMDVYDTGRDGDGGSPPDDAPLDASPPDESEPVEDTSSNEDPPPDDGQPPVEEDPPADDAPADRPPNDGGD